MNETERVLAEAIEASRFCTLEVQPAHVAAVVQYLNENGFDLVPKTIIGSAGWTPSELRAWQAGVMWARHERNIPIAIEDL